MRSLHLGLGCLTLGVGFAACTPLAGPLPQPETPVGTFAVTLKEQVALVGRVGERVALTYHWFDERVAGLGLSWVVTTPDQAKLVGADTLQFLAPGPVRLRAEQGARSQDNFLLAAVSQPQDAPELGQASWGFEHLPTPLVLWVRGLDGWRRVQAALGEGQVGPPPAGWDPAVRDVLLVNVVWGDTSVGPVALTHRDEEGQWHLVVCSQGPYMVAAQVEARLHRFLLPPSSEAPRLMWHDLKGDRLIESTTPEEVALAWGMRARRSSHGPGRLRCP